MMRFNRAELVLNSFILPHEGKESYTTMPWLIARICVFCVVIMLFAPSLKVRFELSDLLVYYVPICLFALGTITLSFIGKTYLFERIAVSFIYFLFFAMLSATLMAINIVAMMLI